MSVNTEIRILLVEDAGIMRKMEMKTLNQLGFQNILQAEDGNQAIEVLSKEDQIDLVISDWNMPNKDGFELLQWVRAQEVLKELPFIMATGRGEKKEVAKASEAGVSSFIAKPFNADELSEKIEEAFGIKIESVSEEESAPQITRTGKVLIRMAHIQITDHLILGVLKHLIRDGKMNPQTFELETQCMPSWNPVAKALENGRVEGACVLAPIAMDLFGFGTPIKLILFAHKNGSIFVRNIQGGVYQEPYQNFFRNKTFYLPHFQSVHHMLAHMFFKGIGIVPGVQGAEEHVDVHFEVVPPIKMPELLGENDEACGYLVAEPLGTKAIASGIAELQFFSSELWENHPCCVVTMQDSFIQKFPDAVFEFTELLVQAGKFIERKPGLAAEIGVQFLDPDKMLGLKVPLLKNVLTEPMGITTGDLFPVKEDLDRIQRYMHENMGIGKLIDIDSFVDLRFAFKACKDRIASTRTSVIHDSQTIAMDILRKRTEGDGEQSTKALLNKEGKYLTFTLGDQQFGIDILKIREIIRMVPIRTVPKSPEFIRGMINLRGKVIPIVDLRTRFHLKSKEVDRMSRIIVLELDTFKGLTQMGVLVDKVSEVLDIEAKDIEDTPSLGEDSHADYILALAKIHNTVTILLNIDQVFEKHEAEEVSGIFKEVAEIAA